MREVHARHRIAELTVHRPRCPKCGSTRLRVVRTMPPQGDGSTLQYRKCSDCGTPVRVIVE